MESLFVYYLTNTNLVTDDSRVKFLKFIRKFKPIEGWGGHDQRLGIEEKGVKNAKQSNKRNKVRKGVSSPKLHRHATKSKRVSKGL